jgi:hypothetical protein
MRSGAPPSCLKGFGIFSHEAEATPTIFAMQPSMGFFSMHFFLEATPVIA